VGEAVASLEAICVSGEALCVSATANSLLGEALCVSATANSLLGEALCVSATANSLLEESKWLPATADRLQRGTTEIDGDGTVAEKPWISAPGTTTYDFLSQGGGLRPCT